MDETTKIQEVLRSVKDILNIAVVAYIAIKATKGLTDMAKDAWDSIPSETTPES